ncbi:MAG: hypothetical protein HKN21_12260 [Candidatus Eisenbacteria bacterium]|uniref:Aspartate racemase n=1 Tax=Eiseniibacteriota bacterium TaxID=2212470 RepID=A0A7Y2E976_UNCEI|nr:hypothetical protein [Candidatus Eisenbacteria bacterium]
MKIIFEPSTTKMFGTAIDDLRDQGAECVILGCTEIPLIITQENSSLPVLDSTRLLAKYAVREAIHGKATPASNGWIAPRSSSDTLSPPSNA